MKKIVIFGFSLLVILFFTRCSLKDDLSKLSSFASDSLQIVLSTPEFSHTIHFEVRDAATQEYLTNDVKIKLSGAGASKVYDNLGEQSSDSTYTAVMGILDLVLDPRIDSTTLAANPVTFNVTPIVDGYVGVQQTVQVSNGKFKIVSVDLINLSGQQPSGISVSQTSLSPTYNGDQTSSAVLQQIDGTNTTLEVESNTTLKNASGQVLKGSISSQVVFYSPTDDATRNILSNSSTGPVQFENNQTANSRLYSAGMFSAVLKVGNETVKTLAGGGLKLKTRIPADLINPITGKTTQEGDTLKLFSKDENGVTWKFEKKSVVKRDADGLYFEDVVNHLSDWNLTIDDSPISILFHTTLNWKLVNFNSGQVNIQEKISNQNWRSFSDEISNNSTTTLYYGAKNVKLDAFSYNIIDKAPIPGRHLTFSPDSITATQLSATDNITITVTATTEQIVYNADVTVKIHSDDPTSKTIITPSTYIYYSLASPMNWISAKMSNGLVSLQLVPGTSYTMFGLFGSKWVIGTFRLNDIGNNQVQFVFSDFSNTVNNTSSDPIDIPTSGSTLKFTYNVTVPASTFGSLQKVGRSISR